MNPFESVQFVPKPGDTWEVRNPDNFIHDIIYLSREEDSQLVDSEGAVWTKEYLMSLGRKLPKQIHNTTTPDQNLSWIITKDFIRQKSQ